MKTSKILTTTSLVALLASLGAVACGGAETEPAQQAQTASLAQDSGDKTPAPEAMRPAPGDRHRGGRDGMRRHGPPNPDKMIERFDANKNGTLEAAELPERMQEHIGDIDSSGDGVVTKDELAAHMKARFAEHAKERFARQDTNKDGTLEQSELGAEKWSHLSVADQNGDQKLTAEELRAAFESGKIKPPVRGERGERGKRFEHEKTEAAPAPAAPAL
jgi:hypothetical protein